MDMDNGYWQKDFPMIETYVSASGRTIEFEINAHLVPTGYTVIAVETDKSKGKNFGYTFSFFSPSNPYLALGQIRAKIRGRLSTRFLQKNKRGMSLTHDELVGRIEHCPDEEGTVIQVDGTKLTIEQLSDILSTYQGFEVKITILQDDVR